MLKRTHLTRLPEALRVRLERAETDLADRIDMRDRRMRRGLDGDYETSDLVRKRLSWLLAGIRKHRGAVDGRLEEA